MWDREQSPAPEDEPYDLDDEGSVEDGLLDLSAGSSPNPEDEIVIDLDEAAPIGRAETHVHTPAPSTNDPRPPIHALDPTLNWRGLSDDRERDRAIAEVLRDQARREVLRNVAYRANGASLRRIVAVALVAAALAVWFLPVPGLQAGIPFPLAPEEEEAGLLLATWVQAQQVEAFRLRRGRLPDVLRETGEALPGMTYERLDAERYRLSGITERMAVTWFSTDTLDSRTRDSVARLRGGQP